MVSRTHFKCGVLAFILACVPTASAETKISVEKTCPICQTKFKAVVSGSGTQFGQRLDLRRLGAIASPWIQQLTSGGPFVTVEIDHLSGDRDLSEAMNVGRIDPFLMLPQVEEDGPAIKNVWICSLAFWQRRFESLRQGSCLGRGRSIGSICIQIFDSG